MRVGRKRIPFPCHLKSRTCFAFLPPHLSSSLFTSSPFPPHHPPTSILPLWFLVHLWPLRPPQETHQLCLGLQPSQFTCCACACLRVLWTVYKYTILGHVHTGDCSQARVHCLARFPQNGPPTWQHFCKLTRPWKWTQTGCRTISL